MDSEEFLEKLPVFEMVLDKYLETINLEPYFERGGMSYCNMTKDWKCGIHFKDKYRRIRKTKRRDLMNETFPTENKQGLKISFQYGRGDGSVDVVWIKWIFSWNINDKGEVR